MAQIANQRRPVSLCNKPDHRSEAFSISPPRLNDIQRRFWALNPPKSGYGDREYTARMAL
jgi:hypothetical protein